MTQPVLMRRTVLSIPAACLLLMIGATPAGAQPACPGGTTTLPPINGSFTASGTGTASHGVTLAPCETIVIAVSGYGDPQWGGSLKVELFGQTGVRLANSNRACYGACTFQVPVESWAPHRGTRGPISLAQQVLVTGSTSRPPLNYQLTITKVSRPGYNIGGLSFQDAPLLSNFPKTIYGSLYPYEVGQYFRVRLAAGGTLRASGFAEGHPNYGANLYVYVYRADGTEAAKIVNGSPAFYGRKAFTSSVYTNNSSQPGEFYVRVFGSNFFPLWDLEMTIEAQEGPRLTLFLDANPNERPFTVTQPTSDHPLYVPGAILSEGVNNGLSVALGEMPQRTELIAAYVDSAGQVVTPPPYAPTEATFALADTSAFKGVAMNFGAETTPDFSLPVTSAPFLSDNTARVSLLCHDYGGFTWVWVSEGAGAPPASYFRIPMDAGNSNWLPDAGWKAGPDSVSDVWTPCFTSDTCDDDYLPLGEGTPAVGYRGDGFTRFEEFRGFIVRGVHRRTHPIHKDLFISSLFFGTTFSGIGIYYAYPALPTATHRVNDTQDPGPDEYDAVSRVINTNYENYGFGGHIPAHEDQRALRVVDGVYAFNEYGCNFLIGALECLHPTNDGPRTPNEVDRIEIYTEKIYEHGTGPLHNYSPEQLLRAARVKVGHEVGHTLNLVHRPASGCIDTPTTSVMDAGTLCAPFEGDPGATYLLEDIPKLRLHFRF